jgi:hypothetical protein
MKAKVHRLTRAIALSLAAAAVIVPAAQAERPDDRAGRIGVGATSSAAAPDAFERALNTELGAYSAGAEDAAMVPDAFERALNTALQATATRPDDRSGWGGLDVVPEPPIAASSVAGADGFEWADAAVGAGAALGLLLAGMALLLTIRHRGRVIVS